MMRFAGTRISLGLAVIAITMGVAAANAQQAVPGYVASARCVDCHEGEATAWRGSHHALAWTSPRPETVIVDFDGATFEHRGVTSRFGRDGGDYFIETRGADGAQTRFKVAGVAGVAPLQQYLLDRGKGRACRRSTWPRTRRRGAGATSIRTRNCLRATGSVGPDPIKSGTRAAPNVMPRDTPRISTRRRAAAPARLRRSASAASPAMDPAKPMWRGPSRQATITTLAPA